ncbi:MAG: HAMP domain-containing histidine kinase [Thaumarchaeota archaeon]|nr:HAMP domain-containing histidine kinase [Nitrososphaerota archaeon]
MKLDLQIIFAMIGIMGILAASGYAILSQLDKLADPISNQIPKSIEDLAEKSSKDGYAQLIRYYDEILTQSARNYAFTQDKKWEERYREAEPKLIEVIDKAIDAGDDLEKDFFSQVDEANIALVEMEYAALDLVNAGKASEAIDILESQEYWDYKNFYLDGLNDYVSNRGVQYEQAIETSTTTLDDLSKTTQVLMTDSRNAFFLSFPLILATLFIIAYLVHRTIINPIKKLKDAANSIGTGKFDTNVVVGGNDEIYDLSKSFNEMSKYLKKYQEEIIRRTLAEERSLDLEKIEKQKDEFVAMISHELKSPLTPIKIYTSILKKQKVFGKLNQKQIDSVNGIDFNTLRLEKLIEDLLDFQRLETGRMMFTSQKFSVNEILDESVKEYQMMAGEKDIQITSKMDEEITIFSDKKRIEQVLENLCRNSIDFVHKDTGIITIFAEKKDNDVLFAVKDNGRGILKEKQKKLFTRFYQADTSLKRKHGGTGLGLSICKGIVEGLGGKIWLESTFGKGTNVYFTIPTGESQ